MIKEEVDREISSIKEKMEGKWAFYHEWLAFNPSFSMLEFCEYLVEGGYGQEYANVGDSRFYDLAEQFLEEQKSENR